MGKRRSRGPLGPLAIASVAVLLVVGMAAPALADDPPGSSRAVPVAKGGRAAPSGASYDEVVSYAQDSARDLVALQQEAHEVATQAKATLAKITALAVLTTTRTTVRDRLEREALRLSASSSMPSDITLPTPVREAADEMRALRAELNEQFVALDTRAMELAPYAAVTPANDKAWMTPAQGWITQGFGPTTYRLEPSREYRGVFYAHFHEGIDIGADMYSAVVAAAAGRVVWVGHLPDGAMVVLIAHSGGLVSLYAHLDDRIAPPRVATGDQVQRGQIIATVGMTGMTTGPHLHFVLWRDGELIDPLSVIAP